MTGAERLNAWNTAIGESGVNFPTAPEQSVLKRSEAFRWGRAAAGRPCSRLERSRRMAAIRPDSDRGSSDPSFFWSGQEHEKKTLCPLVSERTLSHNRPMEAAILQRHFRSAGIGGKGSWLTKLTATQFVQRVVAAKQDRLWVCGKAGNGGIAFFLAADKLRHARLVFQHDKAMGVDGAAAPMIFLGTDEISLYELPSDDLVSWTMHLRNRRNSNESDIDFIRALFSVLKL